MKDKGLQDLVAETLEATKDKRQKTMDFKMLRY